MSLEPTLQESSGPAIAITVPSAQFVDWNEELLADGIAGGIFPDAALNPADLATPLPNSVVVELPECVNGKSFGYPGNGYVSFVSSSL